MLEGLKLYARIADLRELLRWNEVSCHGVPPDLGAAWVGEQEEEEENEEEKKGVASLSMFSKAVNARCFLKLKLNVASDVADKTDCNS